MSDPNDPLENFSEPTLARPRSDLPRQFWWTNSFRLYKTVEVFIFRFLQRLGIYTPQKTIVAIPSLATPAFTVLQAVVYNGTLQEVLGFKPRRLLYRLLRGIPDTEMYERVKFQLSLPEGKTHIVEAGTQSRGFIQLHMPWPAPQHGPSKIYPLIQPMGINTLVGPIGLGEYEIFNAPCFFLTPNIKRIIISDIDDTIKESRIAETANFKSIVGHLIRGHHYAYDPVEGMADLYQKLVQQNDLIIYLTSTPFQLAPFLLKFLKQNNFPEGPIFMRWLGYGRIGHKWRVLKKLLPYLTPDQKVFLIGDSGERDWQVYRRAASDMQFGKCVTQICIRHVPGTTLLGTPLKGECVYKEVAELEKILLT